MFCKDKSHQLFILTIPFQNYTKFSFSDKIELSMKRIIRMGSSLERIRRVKGFLRKI